MTLRSTNRIILRVDRDGRVAAMNKSAERVLGNSSVGKLCDEVVRGVAEGGEPLCRPGCARGLALGELGEQGEKSARICEQSARARIECARVGSEVHVLIEVPTKTDPTETLTPRERSVLTLVAKGLSSREISRQLGISVATVRTHVEHARGRLGATTRAQAVLLARESGQLDEA
jgi:DNA-binding NarL/FixJ family response regulator